MHTAEPSERGVGGGRLSGRRVVVAGALFVPLLLGSCSVDDLIGGEVPPSTYPPVRMETVADGSVVVPPAFPKSVPVVSGRYRLHRHTSASTVLQVSDAGSNPEGDAVRLLEKAGFRSQQLLGQPAFIDADHIVTVAADPLAETTVWYTVRATSSLPDLPKVPAITVPRLF